MGLYERDIEDIIYDNPWLLDTNLIVPKIIGRKGYGRQINIGNGKRDRFIDLLFKDIRDSRPVIVELKREKLQRENIAQILEYKALMISMSDEIRSEWKREFDINYFCPKLILVGLECPEEVLVSANLAGIEVRTLGNKKYKEIDLDKIDVTRMNVKEINDFIGLWEIAQLDRREWAEKKYQEIKSLVTDMGIDTLKVAPLSLMGTTVDIRNLDGDFWFLSFYIQYKSDSIMLIYEYSPEDDRYIYSPQYIYVDIFIGWVLGMKEHCTEARKKASLVMEELGYNVTESDDIIHLKIERSIFYNSRILRQKLICIIQSIIKIIEEFKLEED